MLVIFRSRHVVKHTWFSSQGNWLIVLEDFAHRQVIAKGAVFQTNKLWSSNQSVALITLVAENRRERYERITTDVSDGMYQTPVHWWAGYSATDFC